MAEPTTAFHTILLSPWEESLANHRWYCGRQGLRHHTHTIASGDNSDRSRLLYKFSVVRRAVEGAAEGTLLVFADESAAICEPLHPREAMGGRDLWIAKNTVTGHADSCFFMLRAGPRAREWAEAVLEQLRAMRDEGTGRWDGVEVQFEEGLPFEPMLPGGVYPAFLFTNFGMNLPGATCFVLSFNARSHSNAHDTRMVRIFLAYLNGVQARGGVVFDDLAKPPAVPLPEYEVTNPGRPVALVTSYTPNIAGYARLSEANVREYCLRHGYTHHVYRQLPEEWRGRMAGSWVKPRMMLRHLEQHDQVAWVDADIVITDLARPLESITRGRAVTLARDISGHQFNSGFMVFTREAMSLRLLERTRDIIDGVADKSSVYASGSDQGAFIAAWTELGGASAMPLLDSVSFNSHPALYGSDTFMLHYMGYWDAWREVVMRHDCAVASARLKA